MIAAMIIFITCYETSYRLRHDEIKMVLVVSEINELS